MLTLIKLIKGSFTVYSFLILANILSSWFPAYAGHPIVRAIKAVTEPYLKIFRRFIPLVGGTLDISPIVALIVLRFVEQALLFWLIR